MNAINKVWKWWLYEGPAMLNEHGGNEASDIGFAVFFTFVFGSLGLFFALLLLVAIIASKGIVLFVLLTLGAVCYCVWKAIDATVNGDS